MRRGRADRGSRIGGSGTVERPTWRSAASAVRWRKRRDEGAGRGGSAGRRSLQARQRHVRTHWRGTRYYSGGRRRQGAAVVNNMVGRAIRIPRHLCGRWWRITKLRWSSVLTDSTRLRWPRPGGPRPSQPRPEAARPGGRASSSPPHCYTSTTTITTNSTTHQSQNLTRLHVSKARRSTTTGRAQNEEFAPKAKGSIPGGEEEGRTSEGFNRTTTQDHDDGEGGESIKIIEEASQYDSATNPIIKRFLQIATTALRRAISEPQLALKEK